MAVMPRPAAAPTSLHLSLSMEPSQKILGAAEAILVSVNASDRNYHTQANPSFRGGLRALFPAQLYFLRVALRQQNKSYEMCYSHQGIELISST